MRSLLHSTQLKKLHLSPEHFPKTWSVLQSGLSEEVAPGFVVGVWQKQSPDQIYLAAAGDRRKIPSVLPMEEETVFDLASLTKVMATATLAARLVDRGWITWNTPVSSVLQNYTYKNIEVRHLLSHTAGLVWWQPFWQSLKEHFAPDELYSISVVERQKAMRKLVYSVPPEYPPGDRAVYSDLSFLLLGFLLEDVTRMSLDEAVKKWVWKPMGIRGAYFKRVRSSAEVPLSLRVAATENCPWRGGILQGQVHDDNCWAMGGYGGHAGVFGTARDVLHFARGLMMGFLSPPVLKAAWTKVSHPVGCERTLGWDTPSGEGSSVGQFFCPIP